MNRDKKGRLPKDERRKMVRDLRDKNYSYSEISRMLNITRSLARYYDIYTTKTYSQISS